MATQTLIQFSRVSKANIGTVPIKDGNIVVTKDTGEIFYDKQNSRIKLSSYIEVPDIDRVDTGIAGKIYYGKLQNSLYAWDAVYTRFVKILNVNGDEVPVNVAGIQAHTLGAALAELLSDIGTKVDKNVAGAGGSVLKDLTLTGSAQGLNVTKVTLSLEDGSTQTITNVIDLADLDIASKESVDAKLDKSAITAPIVIGATVTPIAAGGFTYTVTTLDVATGEVEVATTQAAATDLNLATLTQFGDLQSQIDTIRGGLLRFNVDFEDVFGTATPTKTDVDGYFHNIGVTPVVGTSIKNSHEGSSTYQHVFTYYTDEQDPTQLKLVDDGIDNVVTASSTVLGVVKGGPDGDINIDQDGDMHLKAGSVGTAQLDQQVKDEIDGKADKTTTVNGHALSSDVVVAPQDIAYTNQSLPNVADVKGGLDGLASGKVDKISGGVQGNIPVIGQNGELTDSGSNLDSLSIYWEDIED